MSKLTDKIQAASQKYYTDGTSELSDEEFDQLLGQLKVEDPTSPLLSTGHGYDVSKNSGKKVKHRYGLVGSLDKCHSWIEIPKDLRSKLEFDLVWYSLKLDGLSVVLYYKNSKFVKAVTRGDGTTGIDITDKASFILMNQLGFIPEIDTDTFPDFTGAIRGEILMSNSNFEKFKQIHPEAKNSRNSTAGLINSKDLVADLKLLNLYVYRIVGVESEVAEPQLMYSHVWSTLNEFARGVDDFVAPHTGDSVLKTSEDPSAHFESQVAKLKQWWYNELPADGIVITTCDIERVGNELVYDSIAYKYPSEVKEATVVDVLWDMSKTNYLIPRIQIEPVEIAGSTVQFCTGIHAQAIQACGVGPGSKIKITKANEIIPQMLEVLNKNPIELPSTCPECGHKLQWNGVHLQCPNQICRNLQKQDLLAWFHALAPLDGLGDTLILKYIEEMFGKSVTLERIYEYGKLISDSTSVQRNLFVTAYNKLFESPIKLEDAILALNIPRFGSITASKCSSYSEEFKEFCRTGQLSEKLKSLGAANYESLENNTYKLSRLNLIYKQIEWSVETVEHKGEVCITGKLSVKRSEFEKELKSAGYTISSSVKKSTSYLITDDPNSTSSKNKAAEKYGITKISEAEFRQTLLNS